MLGEEERLLLVPFEDFAVRNVNLEDVEAGMQHPRDLSEAESAENAQKAIRDFTYVKYGSKYLEEKVWPHIFWRGTGGFYKPEAHGWSRRDYVTFRTLMVSISMVVSHVRTQMVIHRHTLQLYAGLRKEHAWTFYQTDQMIKEMIRGYNFVTVKVANLATPLVNRDLVPTAESGYEPYNRFGKVVPVSIPNSRNFMASKGLDLLALSGKKGREPCYLITLTQNDNWPEFQTSIRKGPAGGPNNKWNPGCRKEEVDFLSLMTEGKITCE